MLPHFLIIGAQRSGTTSLFEYLIQQPGILPPLRKEVHYFNIHHRRSMAWYKHHFPLKLTGRAQAWTSKGIALTGEATPDYLFDPHSAARIKAVLPEAKLIVVLRNPVDRAYSHYQLNRIRHHEHLSFEAAIDAEGERITAELEHMRQDANYRSIDAMRYSYLARGLYASQLRTYLSAFPRRVLLVIRSEDMFHAPDAVVQLVMDFFGLPFVPFSGYGRFGIFERSDPIAPAMRSQLDEFFRVANDDLYHLLGRDMGWNA